MSDSSGDFARLGLGLDSQPFVQGARDAGRSLDDIKSKALASATSLNKFEDTVAKAASGLQSFLSKAAAGFAAFKLAEYLKDATQLAARYQTLGIVLGQVGQAAGYSASQLSALTHGLQTQGISMLQSRQTILSMIQGHMDLARAVDLARVAQDAAVVANLNSSETLARLQYGIQSAQVDVLRTIGINVQFEASYAKLAAQLHTTAGALSEQQKMTARTNAVLEAAVPLTGAYEAAMGTASKQMKSMERYAEDLKVRLGQLFTPAYNAIVLTTAEMMKLAAHNTELLMVPIATLIAYKLAGTLGGWITQLRAYATGLAAASAATSSQVVADAAAAASAARLAEMRVTSAAAALADAEGTELETAVMREYVLAVSAATEARAALAVTETAATASTIGLTLAQRALGVAATATKAAFNFLATNWIAATFIAIAAAVAFLVTHQSDLDIITKKYGETAADAGAKAADGMTKAANANQFHARQQIAVHALTKEQTAAEQELLTVREAVFSQAQSLYTTDVQMGQQFNVMISNFRSGKTSAGEFNEQLVLFQQHWSQIHPEMKAVLGDWDRFHDSLEGIQGRLDSVAKSMQTITGMHFVVPGSASPNTDPKVFELNQANKEQQASTAAVAAALRSGGQRGAEAAERQNAAIKEATTAWKSLQEHAEQYVPAAEVAAVKTLDLRDAMHSADTTVASLARNTVAGSQAAKDNAAAVDLQKQKVEQYAAAARAAATEAHALQVASAQRGIVNNSLGSGTLAIGTAEHVAEQYGKEDAAREQVYARYADRILGVTNAIRQLHKAEADRAAQAVHDADAQEHLVSNTKLWNAALEAVREAVGKTNEAQATFDAEMTGSPEAVARVAEAITFWKTATEDGALATGDFSHALVVSQEQFKQWQISVNTAAHDEQEQLSATRDAHYRRIQAQMSGIEATRKFAVAEAELTERTKLLKMGLSESLPQFAELVKLAGTNAGLGFDENTTKVDTKQWKTVLEQMQQMGTKFFEDFFNHGISSAKRFAEEFKQLIISTVSSLLAHKALQEFSHFFNKKPAAATTTDGTAAVVSSPSILQKAGYGAMAGYAVGTMVGSSTGNATTGALGGAAGGAAAGYMVGGPWGAAAGAAVGAISGLVAAHKKAKEAAEAMAKAQVQLAADMSAFHATSLGQNTALADQLRQNTLTRDKLIQEAKDAYKGTKNEPQRFAAMDQIEADYQRNAARLATAFAQEVGDVMKEDQARGLSAMGDTRGAEDIRRQAAHDKEIADYTTKGYNDATIAGLKYAQTLEDQAVAAQRVAEDLAKAQEAQRALVDLQVRYLQATGQSVAADDKARQQARDDETNKALADKRDPAYMAQLKQTQDAEEARVQLDRQIAETNAKAALSVRGLTATGQTYLAASQAFLQQQREEMQKAADQSEAYRAQLAYTQEMERQAFEQQQLRSKQASRAQFDQDFATARGDDRGAYWINLQQQTAVAKQSAADLVAAGIISATEYTAFAKVLDDKLTPAARAASDAVAAMADSMSKIQASATDAGNYFKYTGADDETQLNYYTDLYGYKGKSRDDVLSGLHKPSSDPNAQLSDSDRLENDKIYKYLDLYDRLAHQPNGVGTATPNGRVTATLVGSAFQGLDATQGNRLGDLMTELVTQSRLQTHYQSQLADDFSDGVNANGTVTYNVNVTLKGDLSSLSSADKDKLIKEVSSVIGRNTRQKIALSN